MKSSRVLIATGYGLALLLIVPPLLQPVVSLLPLQLGEIRWRLEAFGVVSQALLLPMAGATVAIRTGAQLSHRRVVRVLSVIAFLAAALIVIAAALFVLDLLQYRAAVGPALRRHYTAAGATYLTAFALEAAFLLWLGTAAWRAAARSRRVIRTHSEPS